MNNKKISILTVTLALSLVLSYIESLVVIFPSIPGIKPGLANIAIIFALFKYEFKDALLILILRVFIVATLFGSMVSFMYSLAGGLLSILTMFILKKLDKFSIVGVSVCGGIMHNVGQLIVASILLQTNVFVYYLPFLLISGVVTGVLVGVLAGTVYKRINI